MVAEKSQAEEDSAYRGHVHKGHVVCVVHMVHGVATYREHTRVHLHVHRVHGMHGVHGVHRVHRVHMHRVHTHMVPVCDAAWPRIGRAHAHKVHTYGKYVVPRHGA